MEEKRNITISLKEAREWYKSNNKALREIALKYYNGDWKMEAGRIGYFIGKVTSHGPIVTKLGDNLAILRHETAQYAGVVYFQKAQDAKDAADLLGDELKLLF